ncbi:type IVB secretion system protein IcmH/DotU [Simiduia agarivorans]|uniref:DotU n=1 Tax=Simiduia agarivorans (strain DSM 21679 / JCM 13881 / BCRC 17597 / SA1) TaxID=1117647 RepID=H8YHZ9_SIMAS|nr:type IVB secretion system protein IcmH/DotU [Simiduia agarivorans]AFD30849.1 DotU [Simiduia agarivorans SA1 = DSM 21679]AFU98090.1 hypothetical protein M5M_04415 [Simiduia agarivorans SA1 = DSM 21679]
MQQDRTIMVPTPGARKGSAPRPQSYAGTPLAERVHIRKGLNPLVNTATTLLAVATKLRTTPQHSDVPDLHRKLTEELKDFEQRARAQGCAEESVVTARYLLCTLVDEIVLNTPWGANSGWSQHSLLSLFHHETFGGEKCFSILTRLLESPGRNLDLLELFYLCLSLGFEGKYRLAPRGHEQLEQVRDNLYQTLENQRPFPEQDLSPHWETDTVKPKYRFDLIPLWVIAATFGAILLLSYSGLRWWLHDTTHPVAADIESRIALDSTIINQQPQ